MIDLIFKLSSLNLKLHHQDILERRVGDVGERLLQIGEYRSRHAGSGGGECRESDGAVLSCYGDPGVGNTFIR